MSPGLRLLVSPGVLVAGALLCYTLPPRARRLARLLTAVAVAVTGGLVLSVAGLVFPAGSVERSLGDLVPGLPLLARGDPTGVAVALVAMAAAAAALAEGARLPIERTALLLCLAGTLVAAFAGNVVLLFGGMELGNVGALLLAAGAPGFDWRPRAAFALQHVAALGLLASAILLGQSTGTSDLAALPAGAVTVAVAWPWAVAGVVRVVAPAALPGVTGRAGSSAWAPVAAVPTGLVVLLRLRQAAGPAGLPRPVAAGLVVAGVVVALAAGLDAVRRHARPAAAGRALSVAAAGPVIALAGVAAPAAPLGMAASGVALVTAVAAAAAWGAGGDEGSGPGAHRLRAMALAVAGGLPLGAGTAALVLGAGATVSQGLPSALAAVALVAAALPAAVGGGLAARSALAADAPSGRWPGVRLDAAVAVCGSAVLAVLPGATLAAIAIQVAGGGESAAGGVDVATVVGPGAGLAAGYLAVATLVAVVAAWAASALQGGSPLRRPAPQPPPTPARPVLAPGTVDRVTTAGRRTASGLAALDRVLVGQPGLVAVMLGALACLFLFR